MNELKISQLTIKICLTLFIIFALMFQVISGSLATLEAENGHIQEVNLTSAVGIVINDTNIASYSSSGTGASDDPFIIDNLTVTTTDSLAIEFDDVTFYYVLRDSYLKGSTYGVYISGSMTSGTASIINCTVEGALTIGGPNALYLNIYNNTLISRQGSSFRQGLNFTKNIVYTTSSYSSSLITFRDENNVVKDNIFYGNFSSVRFSGISNSTIENNVLNNTGFFISDDVITNISNNSFTNNLIDGKPFGFLYNRTDEIITGNQYGQIYLANSINTDITGYSIEGVNVGIMVQNCTDISINNVAVSGKSGFDIVNTQDIKIENCNLDGFSNGIEFETVTGAIIQNNYLNDFRYGIECSYVDTIQINNNTILEVTEYGIYCVDTTNIEIMFNIISCYVESAESELAISISNSENVSIYYNVFISLGETTAPPADERSVINIIWYSVSLEVGNYYSDWNETGTYPLYGDVGSEDLYPFIDIDEDGLHELEEVTVYFTDPFIADSDSDGLDDGEEVNTYDTNPLLTDSDSDGMDDGWEVTYGTNPKTDDAADDPDEDGLTNIEEFLYNTDPGNNDSDSDGMDDGWEVTYGTDPKSDDAADDPDEDGLTNIEEFLYNTDPGNNDTDSDGFSDFEEVQAGTDPLDNTSFPFIADDKSYLGLIIGLTAGFLAVVGVTVFVLIKKGIIKLP